MILYVASNCLSYVDEVYVAMPTERQLLQGSREKDTAEKEGNRKQEKGKHHPRPKEHIYNAQPGWQDKW